MYAAMALPKNQDLGSRLGSPLGPHPVVRSSQTGQEPTCWRKPLEQGWGSARKGEQAQRSRGSQQPQGPHCAQHSPAWGGLSS